MPENKRLRHVVCFRFAPDAGPEQVRAVEKAFADLPSKIDGIVGFEAGRNVSAENLHQGFTHIWVLTFRNAAARDRYLVHPDHRAFSKLAARIKQDVFVFDYLIDED